MSPIFFAQIFLEPMQLRSTGDRDDPRFLGEKPDQTLRPKALFQHIQEIGEELNSPAFPRVERKIENRLGIGLIPERRPKLINKTGF